MIDFHIIIVIYNQLINDSPVVNCFIQNTKRIKEIFIVDNSTLDNIKINNKEFCEDNNLCYVDMNGNYGLAKAYNNAIKLIDKSENNWIILLDQDTNIPENFIVYYENAIKNNPAKKVFCPIIKDSIGIMSPALIKGKKWIHSISSDFNNDLSSYSFINSCMCVQSQVFERINYNEDLFLDCVDHDFVAEIKKNYGANSFYVIGEMEVYQNFSGSSVNSLQSDLTRFKIYKKDLQVYSKKWFGSLKTADKILFFRAVKLCLCHKNFCFLKALVGKKND